MLFWILLALLALFLGLGYYVMNLAVKGRRYTKEALAAQLDKPAYREIRETSLASTGWVASHAHEELHVMSYDGKLLHATFLPKEHAKGTILLFHGYKSCWQIDFGLVLPYYYDTLGYSLLLVDQRAHGQSQGKYLTFGVRERMDVISWATYMGQKLGPDAPLILGGLSMGATTVLMASCFEFPANVRAIIADCGFTSPYQTAKRVLHRDSPGCRSVCFFPSAAFLQGFLLALACTMRQPSMLCAKAGTRFCSSTARAIHLSPAR